MTKSPITPNEILKLMKAHDLQAISALTIDRNGNVSIISTAQDWAKIQALDQLELHTYVSSKLPNFLGWGINE